MIDIIVRSTTLRRWKFWLGLGISIMFLTVALRGLDLEHFWYALRGANYWWLLPSVGVYFVAVLLRTWRWQYMLLQIKPITIARLFPVVVIGYMGNNVYPARAGEVLRSYVLRRNEGVPISVSLTTVVLERLFDGLVMLLFIVVALQFVPLPPVYFSLVLIFSVFFGVMLVVFLRIATHPQQLARWYTWSINHLLPGKVRPYVGDLFGRFVDGLQSLRSPRQVLIIFASSILIWVIEAFSYWCVLLAFPIDVPFVLIVLLTAVVNLFTTIPSTPGHVGTFDAPGIAVLSQFGVQQALAVGFMLVLHVTLWLPITLVGAVYMLRESISWGDIQHAARVTAEPGGTASAPIASEQAVPGVETAEKEQDDVATGVLR